MAIQIQLRNDTAANWTLNNPILASGEFGIERDTGNIKIGDSVTAWNSLGYSVQNFSMLYDANSILKADTDNTPESLTIAEQTLIGRITGGEITDLSTSEVRTLLNIEDGAETNNISDVNAGLLTGGSEIDLHSHAVDLSGSISDTAYGVSWDDETEVAPSKNAVYDIVETKANLGANTFTGAQNFADQQVNRPKFQDVSEVVNVLGTLTGGTDDIDMEDGNVVTATVSTAEQTFTFSNPSVSGSCCSFTLILTDGGSQTVNWPSSVNWADGTEPTLSTTGIDVLVFTTVNGGTTWFGFAAGINMS